MRWSRCLLASTSVVGLLSAAADLAAAQTETSGPLETPTISVNAAPAGTGDYQTPAPSLLKLTEPVRADYAKSVGAEAVFARINAIK